MVTVTIDPARFAAAVFDMDGVVTDTASVHLAAWKRLFDDFLRTRHETEGGSFREFTADDYLRYVDGRRREDGVAAFLASRSITLPWGDPDHPPERETVVGLGRRKDGYFVAAVREGGVRVFDSTVRLVQTLAAVGVRPAVVTASRNATLVLAAAGLERLFEVQVDGVVAAKLSLPGKPDPSVFLAAAARLGASPRRCAVVEDAVAGVRAGRRGGFGLVIGVDRTGHADLLAAAGADVVVRDLSEVGVVPG
jgi:alpha,alpha-trehalase